MAGNITNSTGVLPPNLVRPQIGDLISKAGIYTKPGVITEIKENGSVAIDTDASSIAHYHRYTITNGLTPEEKDQFNFILDEVQKVKAEGEKINALQASIDELKNDPQNRHVVDKLRNVQAEYIRTARNLPRFYELPMSKIE
jgi:hypothetical protein